MPDGKTLLTAGRDMLVKFWTVPEGALFRTVSTPGIPYSLAASPDGNWIAVGMAQGALELWAADGTNRRTLTGHVGTVSSLGFSPNSQKLISTSLDLTTRIWSVEGATLLQTFTDKDAMTQVAVTPQGRFLMTASGIQSYLRLLSNGETVTTRPGTVVALSPDGGLLAAHDQQNLYLRAFPSLDPIASLPDAGTATALAFSGDGKFLAACYGSAGARLFSPPGLKLVSSLGPSAGLSLSLEADAGGRYFALSSGKTIQLYSLPLGAAVPVCFMDVAASAPTASGIQYTLGGLAYTVPCGVGIPGTAHCTCNCVPGFCSCVENTGCSCVSDTGCQCVSDNGCTCVSDCGCVSDTGCGCVSNCSCVSDTGCGCVSNCSCVADTGCGCVSNCSCVSDTGCGCVSNCGCVSDTGCGCVSDYGCGCVSDYGCGCVGDSGCGCVGDSGGGGGCGCDGDSGGGGGDGGGCGCDGD